MSLNLAVLACTEARLGSMGKMAMTAETPRDG
jgi:hypothetical protein